MSAEDIRVRVEGKPEGTLISRFLGLEPFLLIEIGQDEDEATRFSITVGGGVPVDTADLAEFFEGLAEVLRDGTVTDSNVPGVEVPE